ncbi:valine--tRNA ligase [Candidatus Woesearchaeota archaeon]|nr:valine--tRNA ligase [Candidatus Woesearchaeota archaeon]
MAKIKIEDLPKQYQNKEKDKKKIYSIDTPPPTVSGQMHIGHAFSYTQGDFIARYHRMKQEAVFYPFGTDDNGLPTERLVEKVKKVKSTKMQRSEFVELCLKSINELKAEFVRPWKELGISADFENSYSTIDPHCMLTSQKSFIDLYKKGRVFQEESPITWCPLCQTAIAQAEFENIDMNSHFNDVIFKVHGKNLIIATTRPELIPACVAIVAHPSDERYTKLFGKFARVPLFDYDVPIIADDKANPEIGTGIVMACTFGDKTDVEWWREYNLPLKIVITKEGKMNELAGKYQGLPLKEARKEILNDLKTAGLLIAQKPITHAVNVHERCSTELEFLKTRQWYIKVLDKKEELIEAGNKIKWYPEHMKVRYTHWVENLQWDWCISRQRHFGVPFPVWYCKKCGEIKVAELKQLPVDPMKDKPKAYDKNNKASDAVCDCGSKEFLPETDVMDTWATSSVTPQIALNWVENKEDKRYKNIRRVFESMFPMSVRLQAHDIIRTWAFYTIVKGIYHHNQIPWKEIMISGHALDPKGEKMSKSKGNVVDPVKIIERYNADALRFWAAGSTLGDDLPFLDKDLVTGQKIITKLWNASKFTAMNLVGKDGEADYDGTSAPAKITVIDLWLLAQLNELIKNCTESFDNYEYAKPKLAAEKFFWHTFCDNYLEIVKDRFFNRQSYTEDEVLSAQYTLYNTILAILKIIAPIMPHITEEIYHIYFAEAEKQKSIHVSEWPKENRLWDAKGDATQNKDAVQALAAGNLAIEVISAVRRYKTENKMAMNLEVAGAVIKCKKEDKKLIELVLNDIKNTVKIKELNASIEKIADSDLKTNVDGLVINVTKQS